MNQNLKNLKSLLMLWSCMDKQCVNIWQWWFFFTNVKLNENSDSEDDADFVYVRVVDLKYPDWTKKKQRVSHILYTRNFFHNSSSLSI